MKIGDTVITEHGRGVIKQKENSSRYDRYEVELEDNPFDFTPWYFKEDIKLEKEKKKAPAQQSMFEAQPKSRAYDL